MIKNLMAKAKTGNFKTIAIFTSGNFLVAIVGGISGIISGQWIEPGVLGEFNKYTILPTYLGFGIIFVDSAFQRHFPYYMGKGDTDRALEIAAVSKWWYLMLLWIGVALFGGLCLWNLIFGDYRAALGWFTQIALYGVATYGLYSKILYRSNADFLKLNKNGLITTGVGTILLPLIYFFNYWGLGIRTFLQNLTNIYTHDKYAPFKVKARFNPKELVELAKVSIPLQVPVYLDTFLLKATVSLIIVQYMGEAELGIYGMALMLQGFLLVFSQSINQIFTTKIILNYGKHDNLKKSFNYIIKPTAMVSALGLVIILAFIVLSDPVISFALPKYTASIPVVQILSVEMFLALARAPFTIFTSALMYKEMIILRVAKALVTIGLVLVFHSSLVQIVGIMMIVNALQVVIGYAILLYKIRQSERKEAGN